MPWWALQSVHSVTSSVLVLYIHLIRIRDTLPKNLFQQKNGGNLRKGYREGISLQGGTDGQQMNKTHHQITKTFLDYETNRKICGFRRATEQLDVATVTSALYTLSSPWWPGREQAIQRGSAFCMYVNTHKHGQRKESVPDGPAEKNLREEKTR